MSSKHSILQIGDELGEYVILEKLGKGTYGTIYRVEHKNMLKHYAFKIALNEPGDSKASDQLINEFKAYTSVCATLAQKKMDLHSGGCFPEVYWCQDIIHARGTFTVLCMQLLTSDLEQLMKATPVKKLCLNSVLMIAYQILTALVKLHTVGILHCDIKPDNMMIDRGRPDCLYMLDLGISRRYWDNSKNQHIPYFEYRELHGTARYSSINAHLGVELSRRDDLESMVYLLIYLHTGSLPWQGIKVHKSQEYYHEILKQKMDFLDSGYIEANGLDPFFESLLKYVLGLRFTDLPDYEWIQNLILECANKHNFQCKPWSWKYEWNKNAIHASSLVGGNRQTMRVPMRKKMVPQGRVVAQFGQYHPGHDNCSESEDED